MECLNCSSPITQSSVYYTNGSARVVCSSCGHKANIPTLENAVDQFLTHEEKAQRFAPVALDRKKDPATGEFTYSYPGSNSDPVSLGYERIHLTSLRSIDAHTKSESAKEQELRSLNLHAERQVWDERTRTRREETRALIARKGFSGKYFDAVCKLIDRNREKKYQDLNRKQVSFHSQAFSFDQSNRQGYEDRTAGRRDR